MGKKDILYAASLFFPEKLPDKFPAFLPGRFVAAMGRRRVVAVMERPKFHIVPFHSSKSVCMTGSGTFDCGLAEPSCRASKNSGETKNAGDVSVARETLVV